MTYRKMTVILTAALLMAACTTMENSKPLGSVQFDHIKPYPLYVASYTVEASPGAAVVRLPEGFAVNPSETVGNYFNARYTSAGTQGKLAVVIDRVTVGHKMENSDSKVGAFFDVDKQDVYDIEVSVRLVGLDVSGYEKQENEIVARRTVSVSEHVSMAEREQAQMDAMHALIDNLDAVVRKVLSKQFNVLQTE